MSAQLVLDRLQTGSATTELSRNRCVLIRQFHLLFLTPPVEFTPQAYLGSDLDLFFS